MTTTPTPTPAGAQEGSERASGADLPNIDRASLTPVVACDFHGPEYGECSACVERVERIEEFINDALRETAERAWNEGFMNAASQDHPAFPRVRRWDNPYAAKEADRG